MPSFSTWCKSLLPVGWVLSFGLPGPSSVFIPSHCRQLRADGPRLEEHRPEHVVWRGRALHMQQQVNLVPPIIRWGVASGQNMPQSLPPEKSSKANPPPLRGESAPVLVVVAVVLSSPPQAPTTVVVGWDELWRSMVEPSPPPSHGDTRPGSSLDSSAIEIVRLLANRRAKALCDESWEE